MAVQLLVNMPRRSERPTTPPAFDFVQYAKDSDARMRTGRTIIDDEGHAASEATAQSETRLATRPSMGATTTDESWARSMTGAPIVVMLPDQLRRLPLDHRAGFLLSLMDGTIDLATVIEVAPMPQGEALRVVRDLYDAGVIEFR
jgi:hypothetical protein